MDARTTAQRVAGPIGDLGGKFMLDPVTFGRSAEAGLPNGVASYVQGRMGVLGDVDGGVVADAMYFFADAVVATAWDEPCGLSRTEAAAAYADVCAQWGRDHLADFDDAGRLAELLEAVADGAAEPLSPLCAGWRDVDRPGDGPGRAMLALVVVRELRGDRHLAACRAVGAEPLPMVLANTSEFMATLHGFTDLSCGPALAEQVEAIEAMTDETNEADFAVLADHERAKLVDLVDAAVAHAAER